MITFGIPSLDELFGQPAKKAGYPSGNASPDETSGIYLPQGVRYTSICISGPDGTGKSVLGLHLASQYMADCLRSRKSALPKVLYVSTDLSYSMAREMWDNFALDRPDARRKTPFAVPSGGNDRQIHLNPYYPFGQSQSAQPLSSYLDERAPGGNAAEVGFVDLASATAGDDWGFINRVLAILDLPADDQPRHLMVLDSVEGFETLVGDRDAFGEQQPRRSRIAQVMRSAAEKCHVAFIIEEPHEGERFPEQFVSDVVIRLRSITVRDYVRRTVEIEKTRGQSHVRGQHSYVIRSGSGSTTGSQENRDDPEVPIYRLDENSLKSMEAEPALRRVVAALKKQRRAVTALKKKQYVDQVSCDKQKFLEAIQKKIERELKKGERDALLDHTLGYQSYIHVCPSLHKISRSIMESKVIGEGKEPNASGERKESDKSSGPSKYYAAFGIKYLDAMLAGEAEAVERVKGNGQRGLPCSTLTALIGDPETQKSRLSVAFLSRCFTEYSQSFYATVRMLERVRRKVLPDANTDLSRLRLPQPLIVLLKEGKYDEFKAKLNNLPDERDEKLINRINNDKRITPLVRQASKLLGKLVHPQDGVPVLLTTKDVNASDLAAQFMPLLWHDLPSMRDWGGAAAFERALMLHIEAFTICRRLEVHDLPSAILVHLVQRAIEAAQKMVFPSNRPLMMTEDRFKNSWTIRFVLDDFRILVNTYTDVQENPLVLPFLKFYLGREGVTALLIDTQSGRPETNITEPLDSELRTIVDNRLYTWRFPFYGENRVAIAAVPSLSETHPIVVVRELRETSIEEDRVPRGSTLDRRRLMVDPNLELYAGVEAGKPEPVPLEVRLFDQPTEYVEQENRRYKELFTPVKKAGQGEAGDIIINVPFSQYDSLRDFCYLQRGTRLDHTLVFQVDEYWRMRSPRTRRAGAFRPQWEYLNAQTADPEIDPLGLFQESGGADSPKNDKRRHEFFDMRGYTLDEGPKEWINRIPFTWDFGFLLCKVKQWESAKEEVLPERKKKVGDVWQDLLAATNNAKKAKPTASPRDEAGPDESVTASADPLRQRPSWREFLEACQVVAQVQSIKMAKAIPAFDIASMALESFSCLLLEIWASEVYQLKGKRERKQLTDQVSIRHWKEKDQGLAEWLEAYRVEFFKTWLLLVEVFDFSKFKDASHNRHIETTDQADNPAVAVRHWYKTASELSDRFSPMDPVLPVGLPGHFSVRGDWFLAVAGGSRSDRLADWAVDLLSSRRANFTRLDMGIGLPTRKILDKADDKQLTTLVRPGREGRRERVPYWDVLQMGVPEVAEPNFHWFWRSSLNNYHHHVRIWHQWLRGTLSWWNRRRQEFREGKNDWMSGFKRYDQVDKCKNEGEVEKYFMKEAGLNIYGVFQKQTDFLIKLLNTAASVQSRKQSDHPD